METTDNTKKKVKKEETVTVKFFSVRTSKPNEFVNKLERLCREYGGGDFFFRYSIEG